MPWATYLVVVVCGYLLGSIPNGQIVARLYGVDLTRYGSQRTGATNVLRTLGWRAGVAVFLADWAKGIVAVLLASWLAGTLPGREAVDVPAAAGLAGLGALIGHSYSIFLGFRGGRGVAVSAGALLAMSPPAFVIVFGTGVAVIALTRYVSLGSIAGSLVTPVALLALHFWLGVPLETLIYGILAAAVVVLSHKDNIDRLLKGTERKLGERVSI